MGAWNRLRSNEFDAAKAEFTKLLKSGVDEISSSTLRGLAVVLASTNNADNAFSIVSEAIKKNELPKKAYNELQGVYLELIRKKLNSERDSLAETFEKKIGTEGMKDSFFSNRWMELTGIGKNYDFYGYYAGLTRTLSQKEKEILEQEAVITTLLNLKDARYDLNDFLKKTNEEKASILKEQNENVVLPSRTDDPLILMRKVISINPHVRRIFTDSFGRGEIYLESDRDYIPRDNIEVNWDDAIFDISNMLFVDSLVDLATAKLSKSSKALGVVKSGINKLADIGKFGRLSKSKAKAIEAIKQLNLPEETVKIIETDLKKANSPEGYKKIVETWGKIHDSELDELHTQAIKEIESVGYSGAERTEELYIDFIRQRTEKFIAVKKMLKDLAK